MEGKRGTVVGVALALALVVILGILYARKFIAQDKCLDNGGRWNSESSVCEYATP